LYNHKETSQSPLLPSLSSPDLTVVMIELAEKKPPPICRTMSKHHQLEGKSSFKWLKEAKPAYC